MKKLADLRCCASCEYIFSMKEFNGNSDCPHCYFASYGAAQVHGKAAYCYKKSQKPFIENHVTKANCAAYADALKKINEVEQKRRNIFMDSLGIPARDDHVDAIPKSSLSYFMPTVGTVAPRNK